MHVEKGENYAKFWLQPVSLARSRGFLSRHLTEIRQQVEQNRGFFEEKWNEHFAD